VSKNFSPFEDKNVLAQTGGNVPLGQLVQNIKLRKYISEDKIKEIAIEKYRSS
jgi:hypothetical protein